MTRNQIESILREVKYLDWTFHLGQDGDRLYLQVQFWAVDRATTEAAEQRCRKWMLSPHMTKSEIVQTAFKAVLTAIEHESRELFTYKGKAIFGPHFHVDFLASYCDLGCAQDARVNHGDTESTEAA